MRRDSPEATGGAGYVYEDEVGAYFAAAMLAGGTPLDAMSGHIVRINFQTASRGWALDDLLLTFDSPDDKQPKLGLSLKSGRQFAGVRADPDFVRRAWSDVRSEDGHFCLEHDMVGLATPGISQRARSAYRRLRDLVRTRQPDEVEASITSLSKPQRALWDSIGDPFTASSPTDATTAEFLRHLRLIELDFKGDAPRAMSDALGWCGYALADPSDAEKLWNRLLRLSAEARRAGGSLDRSALLERTKDFRLREFPPHLAAWATLRKVTRRNMQSVRDEVGTGSHLPRLAIVEAVQSASHSFVLLQGFAGSGKTAIAKEWLEQSGPDGAWLDARDLAAAVDGRLFGVRLSELILAHPSSVAVVVDGLDREFRPDTFVALSDLIRSIRDEGDGRVRIVVPAQVQEWPRIGSELHDRNASTEWSDISVPALKDSEVRHLLRDTPDLLRMAIRSRVTSVFRNLKVLDMLVSTGTASSGEAAVSNESDVARMFWNGLVRGRGQQRAGREQTAMLIAEEMADRVTSELLLGAINRPDDLDGLERDGVISQAAGRVRFAHELYGDWTRLQILISREADLPTYLGARLDSPVWHRAIRLYALHLIDGDATRWLAELQRLAPQVGTLRDQFLEAPLYSTDTQRALEHVWPVLVDGDGESLRRFIARFLHAATVPDPRLSAPIADSDPGLSVYLRATYRIPYWPLWIPVLQVLSDHQDEAIDLAWFDTLRVVDLWLRETPVEWPGRFEAARLATASASRMLARLDEDWRQNTELERMCWKALLGSVNELPEAVEDATQRLLRHEIEVPGLVLGVRSDWEKRVIVETDFREVCLSSDGLLPVMSARPDLAQSILRACLAPERVGDGLSTGFYNDLGIRDTDNRETFYTEGPFLRFLQIDPMAAVTALVDVVDIATDGWADRVAASGGSPQHVECLFDGRTAIWYGDENVMFWYRGEPAAPRILASSLMAFEKWLIDSVDAGNDISAVTRHCLANSTSIAIIGVLASLLCHRPTLAKTDLRPLLTVPELYLWDRIYKSRDHGYLLWGSTLRGEGLQEAAHAWHGLPHRTQTIQDLALNLFIQDPSEERFFSELATAFSQRPPDRRPGYIDSLVAMFDRKNWMQEGKDWSYRPPHDLVAKNREFEEWQAEQSFWLSTPMTLRRLIDEGLGDDGASADLSGLREAWQRWVERLKEEVPENLRELVTSQDIACGIAALLLQRFREWLAAEPEVYAWCRTTITDVLAASHPRQSLDLPESAGDWRWDCFAAEGLAVLFADQPDDPEVRRAVTEVVFGFRHEPVTRLIEGMHRRREQIGDDFRRTQHLVVLASRYMDEDEVSAFRRQAAEDYIHADLAPLVPDWLTLAIPDPTPRPTGGDGRSLGISVTRLWASWSFVHSQRDLNDEDRAAWLRHLQLNVSLLATRLHRDVGLGRDEAAGTPYQHEYQLLHTLPRWILDLGNAVEARTLWEPVLELGSYAHYWVESFLNSWVLEGLRADPVSPTFVDIWIEMLEFANVSNAWRRGNAGFRAADNWSAVLGLDWIAMSLWEVRHRPVVERLGAFFKQWVEDWFGDYDAPRRWARFLQTPAGRVLLEDGFPALASAFPRDARRDDEKAEDDVASLLVELWAEERERIELNHELSVAFRSLLRKLVDRQNPIAMELSVRIAGGTQ